MKIRSRTSWRAGPQLATRHKYSSHSRLIVHHTASHYGMTADSTPAAERKVMRQIQAQHRSQGWADIGYSFVIFPSGNIYTGRGWYRVPAAAIGWNTGNIHVSLVGNFDIQKPTYEALRTLQAFARRYRDKTGDGDRALGHRDVNPTACPGKNLYPKLRRYTHR